MLTAEQAVLVAMVLCLGGALVTLVLRRWRRGVGWVAFGTVAVASGLVLAGVVRVLTEGAGHAITFLAFPPLGFALRLYVDGLSAVFLGLIAFVALPASFYSIEYMAHHQEHGLGRYYPNLLVFLAAMYGLVSTTDMMWFFFIFWQMMTWTGWGLIQYERRKPQNVRAAWRYLWMMQLACAVTMIGAGLVASDPVVTPAGEVLMRYDFDAISHQLGDRLRLNSGRVGVAFALFLVGFGIKCGLWPFGAFWLPDAHPAAPSPVSALLSGVMIKTGVYGLMRYFLWLVPAEARLNYPLSLWGGVLLVLGTITLFTGAVQGLNQHQTKRLLAFSSISQVGYIVFGLGACLLLLPARDQLLLTLAPAAFYGALFHTVNHGLFKSLLFLNAGAVLHATGTQNLNKLGGLLRLMPVTGVLALIGSFAIAGVPLFNGYVSKWSIYVAAIHGGTAVRLLPVCALVAILTSGITLALFMKFYGLTFLTRRGPVVAEHARHRRLEVGGKMVSAQLALGAVCVVFGLLPMLPLTLVGRAIQASRQGLGELLADSAPLAAAWSAVSEFGERAVVAPLAVLVVVVVLFALVRWLGRLGGSTRRATAPWLCGYASERQVNRLPAHGLYGEVKRYFRWLGGQARADSEEPVSGSTP